MSGKRSRITLAVYFNYSHGEATRDREYASKVEQTRASLTERFQLIDPPALYAERPLSDFIDTVIQKIGASDVAVFYLPETLLSIGLANELELSKGLAKRVFVIASRRTRKRLQSLLSSLAADVFGSPQALIQGLDSLTSSRAWNMPRRTSDGASKTELGRENNEPGIVDLSTQASERKKKAKVSSIPRGFHTVTPYLAIDGAAAAIDWYKKAFGAKELARQAVPDGKLIHARIRIGDSIVMLSDTFPGSDAQSPAVLGNSPVTLHIYVKDVDKLWQQAVDVGARVTMPLDNQFWGERYGLLTDPFGHHWSLATQVKMSKAERDEKQRQAIAMFHESQHQDEREQAPRLEAD